MEKQKLKSVDMYKRPGPSGGAIALVIAGVVLLAGLVGFLILKREEPPEEPVENTEERQIVGIKEHVESNEAAFDSGLHTASDGTYPVRVDYSGAVTASDEVDDDYFKDALFIGDSITTGIPHYLETVYPDMAVVAERGINLNNVLTGKKVRNSKGNFVTVLEAAKELGNKKKIYVMLGGNDLGFEEAVFLKGYRAFVEELKKQYPEAIIYLQSIPPVTETKAQLENYPLSNNADINHYNELIMALAQEEEVYYLDVAAALTNKSGKLPESASPDGVHFVGEYYYVWMDYLKKHTVGEEE